MSYSVRELSAGTWDVFAELVERNNGVYGGCWCIGYHPECGQRDISHRQVKEDRVRTDRAHVALVVDEFGSAQGWCQYGSREELSNIKHKRQYDQEPAELFEQYGFRRVRQVGKHAWILSKVIESTE